jgi:hypothetical protein
LQAATELLAEGVQPEAAIGVVQRPALGDREDGDMLGQPGVLQIQEPGVLTLRRWKRRAYSASIISPGPIFHRPSHHGRAGTRQG